MLYNTSRKGISIGFIEKLGVTAFAALTLLIPFHVAHSADDSSPVESFKISPKMGIKYFTKVYVCVRAMNPRLEYLNADASVGLETLNYKQEGYDSASSAWKSLPTSTDIRTFKRVTMNGEKYGCALVLNAHADAKLTTISLSARAVVHDKEFNAHDHAYKTRSDSDARVIPSDADSATAGAILIKMNIDLSRDKTKVDELNEEVRRAEDRRKENKRREKEEEQAEREENSSGAAD